LSVSASLTQPNWLNQWREFLTNGKTCLKTVIVFAVPFGDAITTIEISNFSFIFSLAM